MQTYPSPNLQILSPTARCYFFINREVSRLSCMEHTTCILRHYANFTKLCRTKNCRKTFRSRSQSKRSSRLGLEMNQETSSTRARSDWFGLHPTVIAVFSGVQTNATKGESPSPPTPPCHPKNLGVGLRKGWNTLTKENVLYERRNGKKELQENILWAFPNCFSSFFLKMDFNWWSLGSHGWNK